MRDSIREGTNETRWKKLIILAQKGDKNSYRSLLKELSGFISNYLRKNYLNDQIVDDVTQEILVSIHKALHTYDAKRPFFPWLMALIKYRTIDELRKLSRTKAKELVDYEQILKFSETVGRVDSYKDQGLGDELTQALAKLPEKQRDIIQLLKIQGLSVKEIASQTGYSESSIKVSAHRAYKTLRKRLTETL